MCRGFGGFFRTYACVTRTPFSDNRYLRERGGPDKTISKSVLADPPAYGVTLNVNVPYLGSEPPRGIKLCRLGYTDWSSSVHEKVDPRGKPYYWIGGERSGVDNIPESDNQAIDAGYITITPLHYDLTDYGAFESVRGLTCEGLEWQSDALTPEMERHPPSPSSKRAKNS